ncbi:Protein of unknown function [Sphingomonas sp. YR710]|nr:Protein of unknown function [Sphingomonas sp. YR710]
MLAISPMTGEFEAIADVATGTLAARAIAGAGAHDHVEGSACLNCGAQLMGAHCHRCGQSGHVHRTAMALFHDIAHGVFHFEGRTWHTLPMLFWHPGDLTRRYVQGERVKFVSPMALFLFSVFLMAATFSWVGGPTGHQARPATADARADAKRELVKDNDQLTKLLARRAAAVAAAKSTEDIDEELSDLRGEMAGLAIVADGKAPGAAAVNFVPSSRIEQIDRILSHAKENPGLMAYKLQSSAYKFSWALIPISLPFIWMLFMFRRDVGMYDHAIFATYSLSAMTLTVAILSIAAAIGVPQALVWLILFFFPPWHMYRQLKEAYSLGRFRAAWRMVALVISAYTSALIFFIFLVTVGAH